MAEIVNSLFGIDPAALQQQRALQDQEAALKFAGLDDLSRAQYGIALGARGIGRGITQLMGGDEQLNKATQIRQLASQFDMTNPEGIGQFAQAVSPFAPEVAQAALQRRDAMRLTNANIFQKSGENINTLISSGKFTPESLSVYRQTRDPKDLDLVDKGLSNTNKEKVASAVEANTMLDFGISEISNYRDMIKKGEVQYGPLTNLTARASAAIGSPTDNALKQQEIESFLISQINEVLNAAKGVQAKDDALRAERQIKTYLAANSNEGMEKALELLEKTKKNVKKGNEAYINSLTGQSTPNKPTTPTTQNPPKNIYNVVRSRQGWTDATDAEIEAAIKAGKIKVPTGK